MTKKIVKRRIAFTLVELMVVIGIILVVAALAAAFVPRVNDNQNLTRAVDSFEQWLLTAKMRAKRDGLATGLRLVQAPGDGNFPGPIYSQCQYIQQPDPLTGGVCVGGAPAVIPPGAYAFTNPTTLSTGYYTGGLLTSAAAGLVTFAPGGVDFSLGGTGFANQWLVQTGDYLEVRDGGLYYIGAVVPPVAGLPAHQLALGSINPAPPPLTISTPYESSLLITSPTTNYRILRQPRILIGEEPLTLPNNYAINFGNIFGTTVPASNVLAGASGFPEILFSPTGAVIGTNAGNSTVVISIWDTTLDTPDVNRIGIVGVQCRTGFIGAYSVSQSANPFAYVGAARQSGL